MKQQTFNIENGSLVKCPEDDENLRKEATSDIINRELDEQGQMAHKPARMLTPKFILKGSLCAKLSYLPRHFIDKEKVQHSQFMECLKELKELSKKDME